MASPLQTYLQRSLGLLRRNTAKVVRMDSIAPSTAPQTIFNFNSAHPPVDGVSTFATGCDADIGGLSTCEFTAVPADSAADPDAHQTHAALHGTLSLRVPQQYAGRIRTGYAAFRNRSRPTLFGEETWDLELYSHLRVKVAYRGFEQWRTRWVMNLQTDGPVRSDLFQHRLDLPPSAHSTSSPAPLDPLHATGLQFVTLHLPLSAFVLTNSGQTSAKQVDMMRHRIRTIGFALLGGGRDDATASSTPEAIAAAERGKRLAAGGFGTMGADEEPDAELEALLASDRPAGQRAPGAAGGYHRVGEAGEAGAPVLPPSAEGAMEGYYELCVQSVEAVNYDSESMD